LTAFGVTTFEGIGVETFNEAIEELLVIFAETSEVTVGVFGVNTVCIGLLFEVEVGTEICDVAGVTSAKDLGCDGKNVAVIKFCFNSSDEGMVVGVTFNILLLAGVLEDGVLRITGKLGLALSFAELCLPEGVL